MKRSIRRPSVPMPASALGLLNLDSIGLYLQTTETPLLKLFNRSHGGDSFALILHRTLDTLPLQWGHSLTDLFTFRT